MEYLYFRYTLTPPPADTTLRTIELWGWKPIYLGKRHALSNVNAATRTESTFVPTICTCVQLPPTHTKPVPMCTDVSISVPDKTVNLPLGCAGCPSPGVHHSRWEVIGTDACRCYDAVEWIHHTGPINELMEGLFVCRVIRQKFVFIFLIIQQLM